MDKTTTGRNFGCLRARHFVKWRNLLAERQRYWPELLKDEPELAPLGIYVFTFQTDIFSGSYRISDIVDALKEYMRLDYVLKSNQLFFVCHSMGGIVVRKFIVERQAELIGAGKEIDLFLASPSLGSAYADWISPIAQLFGHAQADALRFVRKNNWLMDLDKEFMNLKEGGKIKIKGKELVEDKFVALPKLFGRQVVEPFAGARYFGEPFKVAGSDHFSIAKPVDKNAIQHSLLCEFILENAPRVGSKAPEPESPPSVPPLPQISQVAPPQSLIMSPPSGALLIWQKKLSFLLMEEAKTVDPDQKFRVQESIEEAKAKIREYGGET